MSGGSWDYVYHRIEDVVDRLSRSSMAERRALGVALKPFADALHAIEWVDSNDTLPGSELESIFRIITPQAVAAEIAVELRKQIEQAQKILAQLEKT